MAVNNDTPRISFQLDDSEKTRLEKLRSELKLHHWDRIERSYDLTADEAVAKTIEALKVSDPNKYDEKHAVWDNRFTDFDLKWVKKKDEISNTVQAHLMAEGKLRIKHLGEMSRGCRVSLMRGKMNDDPLPVTRVAPLRVNHVSMVITFALPKLIHNPEHRNNTSDSFKVGRNNLLYGSVARDTNLHKFKEKEEKKSGKITNDLMRSFMKTFITAAQDHSARDNDERPPDDDNVDEDTEETAHNLYTSAEAARYNNINRALDGSYHQRQSPGYNPRQHRPPIITSQEMQDALALTRQRTQGDPAVASGSQQINHGVTEDEADDKNKLDAAHEETVVQPVQVR